MADKTLFASARQGAPAAARNEAGGRAYKLSDRQTLAQLAMTGTLSNTFYASGADQLEGLAEAALKVDPEFLAKTAIYARQKGRMKDAPALLLAILSWVSPELFARAFHKVADDGRMLRTFVQIMRSGACGRASLGSRPKRMIQLWLNAASSRQLLFASIGESPSLADVVKMAHPKPMTAERAALYAWLIGKPADMALLPQEIRGWMAFRADPGTAPVPDVPFQMLANLEIGRRGWTRIAERASWTMTRMNLNAFARHGVFEDGQMTRLVARRLADEKEIRRAKAMPHQIFAAWKNIDAANEARFGHALEAAMETAIDNVPTIKGKLVICPDVSGSMQSPATSSRGGGASKMRCVDVAALIASAMLRRNPEARVLPFDTEIRHADLRAQGKVMGNAVKLAALAGGGTDCAAPLRQLNAEGARPDLVMLVSDNESWAGRTYGRATGVMEEWAKLKSRAPKAKLVCLDIAPYATSPAQSGKDILNVGGFSDEVFNVIADFLSGESAAERQVEAINAVDI